MNDSKSCGSTSVDVSKLTDEQRRVTQNGATERAFSGALLHNKETGSYDCVCCGNTLFASDTKYDSGSGWPSFWQAANQTAVTLRTDSSHGMIREEALCAHCNAHLGHRFPDGPQPSGQRYCINSAALNFTPQTSIDDQQESEHDS